MNGHQSSPRPARRWHVVSPSSPCTCNECRREPVQVSRKSTSARRAVTPHRYAGASWVWNYSLGPRVTRCNAKRQRWLHAKPGSHNPILRRARRGAGPLRHRLACRWVEIHSSSVQAWALRACMVGVMAWKAAHRSGMHHSFRRLKSDA